MLLARAQTLLGTVVSIQVKVHPDEANTAAHAMADAFATIAHIGRVMSAHCASSDLARIARAQPNEVLVLDPDTLYVIRAAQHWAALSGGRFNPCLAAQTLAQRNHRPGLVQGATGSLHDIHICSTTQVQVMRAVNLDFGGIAKGYAVDRAIDVLRAHGLHNARVNAGGDMRAMGDPPWPIDVRHANTSLMDSRLQRKTRLDQHALATSVAGPLNPDFIWSRHHTRPPWRSVTVQASTCLVADVLTKWAMQSSLLCPELRAVLRQNHGRMWRTR